MDSGKQTEADPLSETTEFQSTSAQRASVYVCYAGEDEAMAERLCTEFELRGTPVWFSARDITQAMAWPQCVVEAIDNSKYFVLLLTENARASAEIIPEVTQAIASQHAIIVVQLVAEVLNPKLESMLTESHVIEFADALSDDDIDRVWTEIVEIETESTLHGGDGEDATLADTMQRRAANSFLIQLDCLRGTIEGKISCQLGVGERFVLGRGSRSDVFVDDQRASRQHAGLVVQRDPKYGIELHLIDLKSRNGTWVRYRRDDDTDISKFLEHAKTRIASGAIVRIGSTDIRVTAVLGPTPTAATS